MVLNVAPAASTYGAHQGDRFAAARALQYHGFRMTESREPRIRRGDASSRTPRTTERQRVEEDVSYRIVHDQRPRCRLRLDLLVYRKLP